MSQATNYITEQKKKELETELKDLEGPKRREILDSLEYAKSLGDLKENEQYHQARNEQGQLEDRIKKIKQILDSSEVSRGGGGDIVEVGSKITVQKENTKEEKVYVIVGSEEADTIQGKISNTSPLGQAVMGKKKGDKFSFRTPVGVANYKIINVS